MVTLKSLGFLSGGSSMKNASETINAAGKIVKIAEKIAKVLDKIRIFKKEGQGIYIKVPEKICQYDTIVRVQKSGFLSRKIDFPLPEVKRVIGTCMPSLFSLQNAIRKNPNGFTLSAEGIPDGTEFILMQFQYEIPSPGFIFNLVEASTATEPIEYNDRDEYWMHAQLKFPQILQKAYSHLKLQDVNLNVDVAVDNEIKTAVPNYVTKSLQTIRELLSETERGKAHRLLLKHLQSRRRIGIDIYSLITEIGSIFLRFKNFIHVTEPFRYFDSKQGTDFYDFPGQIVPKAMTVVSRTDLSLEVPAAKGKVIYKKRDLLDELTEVFE